VEEEEAIKRRKKEGRIRRRIRLIMRRREEEGNMKQLVGDKGWREGCYLHEQWTESWPLLSVLRCRTLQMLVGHCLGVREGCPLLS
jgi:hypothetical protein